MDFKKITIAAVIFMICSVLIGFFVSALAPYAAILAALAAGIYAGKNSKAIDGTANGFLAGLIGGIMTSTISLYFPNIAGIPISVSIADFFVPMFTSFGHYFSAISLAVIGIFFGTLGGAMGSIKKLRGIFLFLTLFILFIFYGAIDNMVWNWGRYDWTWDMSVSHVLTNRIDLFVAFVFAIAVTILSYILKVY
jgi:hypothetical protein